MIIQPTVPLLLVLFASLLLTHYVMDWRYRRTRRVWTTGVLLWMSAVWIVLAWLWAGTP